ncbi:putative N-acetyltransferase [Cyphellophora attinorum]|uniref:Putative N-acetyltransferase n=1 Tax=Cyphellophora attinorum TaxID=1664694 RepID=A0A0N0NHS5_9EURO|nr:putative N-acetyltransferase [Phialophora attinorum]KPI34609.1 putative N-acetyltransferase [Phialophora attinorum]
MASNEESETKTDASCTVEAVRSPQDLEGAVALFTAYTTALGIDLAFQDFASEMASMPGKYVPPKGELLLAKDATGQAIGCVALRPLPVHGEHVCEMKRLYVSPDGRGTGVGRKLAETIIEVAQNVGYREMRLDTLPSMSAALKLYAGLGFVDIPPYYDTPLEGTRFLSLKLPRTSIRT